MPNVWRIWFSKFWNVQVLHLHHSREIKIRKSWASPRLLKHWSIAHRPLHLDQNLKIWNFIWDLEKIISRVLKHQGISPWPLGLDWNWEIWNVIWTFYRNTYWIYQGCDFRSFETSKPFTWAIRSESTFNNMEFHPDSWGSHFWSFQTL